MVCPHPLVLGRDDWSKQTKLTEPPAIQSETSYVHRVNANRPEIMQCVPVACLSLETTLAIVSHLLRYITPPLSFPILRRISSIRVSSQVMARVPTRTESLGRYRQSVLTTQDAGSLCPTVTLLLLAADPLQQ